MMNRFTSVWDDRFWILGTESICESANKSPLTNIMRECMELIYSKNKALNLYTLANGVLLCGIEDSSNTASNRLSQLKEIANFLPGCTLDEKKKMVFYKGLSIDCKKFSNEKMVEMKEILQRYRLAANADTAFTGNENRGVDSERIFTKILNDYIMMHPSAWKHNVTIAFQDGRRNVLEANNFKKAIHVGSQKGKTDVVLKLNEKEDIYLSLKNSNAEEWTTAEEILSGPEVDAFLDAAMNSGIIKVTGKHVFNNGLIAPNGLNAILTKNFKGITALMSEELMQKAVFGCDTNFCDAVIIQSFFDGYQTEKCMIEEIEDERLCRAVFSVKCLALSLNDIIKTSYEPRLFIRKKDGMSFKFKGYTYYGLSLGVVFRSRVEKSNILVIDPWKLAKAA